MLLLVDNYDSFVQNLARYFRNLGQETVVRRNDSLTIQEIASDLRPDAIIISPGPCTPNEAGCSLEVIRTFAPTIPILGVCLGHQAIGAALGARIVRAQRAVHGQASTITHTGAGIFSGIAQHCSVGRYHSLVIDETTLPDSLSITARTEDGTIMAVEHRDFPLFGLQFHPESILTDCGYPLLSNFLKLAGLAVSSDHLSIADELRETKQQPFVPPQRPVTF